MAAVASGSGTPPTDASDRRTSDLIDLLDTHRPATPRERHAVARVLALLRWLPRPFDRDADPTHVTSSAIVLDAGGRLLLHRHRRLGIWIQPGGHVEDGEAPAATAVRETAEETGVVADHPGGIPRLLHVDVHEGPLAHVHLDLRYLLRAHGRREPSEGGDVAWVAPEQAQAGADASLRAALLRLPADTGTVREG